MAKEGSTIGGLMDSLGTATSVALQYGVPVESLVNKFTHQRFEPAGMTTNEDIPFAKSLVDYIFRWMACSSFPLSRRQRAAAESSRRGCWEQRRRVPAPTRRCNGGSDLESPPAKSRIGARTGHSRAHRGAQHRRRQRPKCERPGPTRRRHRDDRDTLTIAMESMAMPPRAMSAGRSPSERHLLQVSELRKQHGL